MSKNADYIKQETVTGVVPMLAKDRGLWHFGKFCVKRNPNR